MQVILKQSEITAALAMYMVNVLGATGVTPETLNVVYKQGRSDKNGMTAELEIEAPKYDKPFVNSGGETFLSGAVIGKASVADSGLLAGFGVEPDAIAISEEAEARSDGALTQYEGERRAEDRVAQLNDEIVQHLAEDASEVLPDPETTPVVEDEAKTEAATAPLF